jgi:hypothetical protein
VCFLVNFARGFSLLLGLCHRMIRDEVTAQPCPQREGSCAGLKQSSRSVSSKWEPWEGSWLPDEAEMPISARRQTAIALCKKSPPSFSPQPLTEIAPPLALLFLSASSPSPSASHYLSANPPLQPRQSRPPGAGIHGQSCQ